MKNSHSRQNIFQNRDDNSKSRKTDENFEGKKHIMGCISHTFKKIKRYYILQIFQKPKNLPKYMKIPSKLTFKEI
jgi:hypothetical protein